MQLVEKYSAVSKSQSLCFSREVSNRQFMKFTMFMLDVVNSLSIFRKVSQDRNISGASGNESLQKCLIKLGKFYNDPNCGENWKKWNHNVGKSAKVIVIDEKFCQLVWQLCCEIIDAMIYQQNPT